MNHSIELNIYYLSNPENEFYDEIPLEVTFDVNDQGYEITNYFIDNKLIDLSLIKESNPNIEKQIDHAIDHYISNFEPDYFDCD